MLTVSKEFASGFSVDVGGTFAGSFARPAGVRRFRDETDDCRGAIFELDPDGRCYRLNYDDQPRYLCPNIKPRDVDAWLSFGEWVDLH